MTLRLPIRCGSILFNNSEVSDDAGLALAQAVRAYHCRCGKPVFFRNSLCLTCRTPLGYEPDLAQLLPITAGSVPGEWHTSLTGDKTYARCANLHSPAACNWLLPAEEGEAQAHLCRACRLNRTIPDLADAKHPDNGVLWGRIELAKRRLVSSLLVMGLPVASRETEDQERGLMFDFLRAPTGGPRIMTGHHEGLITLDIMEADDPSRESARKALGETYRTLVGHLRHEIGHYYWDRLVADTPWLSECRTVFGDESKDYAECLQQHYKYGARKDWREHFVSAYASMHPWEDWAECWAHYMHMRDTVDTARSFGLSMDGSQLEFTALTSDLLYRPDDPQAQQFLALVNGWTQLTMLLNGMSRAMGQPDFYPFVLAHRVVAKLHFIHLVVSAAGRTSEPSALATDEAASARLPAASNQSQS